MEGSRPVSSLDLEGLPARLRHLRRPIGLAACVVLRAHGVGDYALSLTFLSDRRIAGLNRRALGRTGPTDVIAFYLSEDGLPLGVVGDIYISADRARVNSRTFKVSEAEEIIRLVVHGVLHVLGYRDDTAGLRQEMERVQEQVVKLVLPRKAGPRSAG